MPQRDNELPEGTDHIINGAMETGIGDELGAADDEGGSTGVGGGFVGNAASDDTGGTSGGGTDMAKGTSGGGGSSNGGREATADDGGQDVDNKRSKDGVVDQLRSQATNLRGQAGERVRDFAEGGKARATDALDELSKVVADTAESIDQRLGGDYGEYARRASDAVAGFADTLRQKDVDQLYDSVRTAVRKSPGIAIGVAAVVGFTLVRLVKAGLSEDEGRDTSSSRGA